MKVLRINAKDTYNIRKFLAQDSKGQICKISYELDEDEETFHLGGFIGNQLVSVASFHMDKNPLVPHEFQYRLIGVATLPEYKNLNISQELLKMAYPIIKQNMCSVVWTDAENLSDSIFEIEGFRPLIMNHANHYQAEGKTLMIKDI